jgi:hypothetical protein
MRLLSGRPRVQLESLEATDLSAVRNLLDRTVNDYAPAGLGRRLDPVEGGLARQQHCRELRPARRTEHDRPRAPIEDVGDRTNDRRCTPVRRTHRQPAKPCQRQKLDALVPLELREPNSRLRLGIWHGLKYRASLGEKGEIPGDQRRGRGFQRSLNPPGRCNIAFPDRLCLSVNTGTRRHRVCDRLA